MKKPRITFCREPRETGLASVTQGTRGWIVKVNGERTGDVSLDRRGGDRWGSTEDPRWFWYARAGAEVRNTCGEKLVTADEAKAACKAWLLKELAR